MLRIAMIGCGHIGTVHAYALRQLMQAGLVDARIATAYDPDPERAERMARHNGATAVSTIDAALDGADVAWICTWTAGHLDAVERAVARSMPVFCEKPLSATFEQCEQVAALLAPVPHQVGLVLRHAPVFAIAADIVQSGRYGRVLTTNFRDDQYFPIQGMYGSTWRSDPAKAGGGTLIEHSIHDVDLLGWILGEPVSVQASTAQRYGYAGIEDTAVVHLGYADGSRAVLMSIWHQVLSRGSSRRLELFCDDAYCWTEDDYLGPWTIQTSDGTTEVIGSVPEWASRLDVPEVYEKSVVQYAEPAKAFLDAIAAGGATGAAPGGAGHGGFPTVREALAAHRIVEAGYRSAADGGRPYDPVTLRAL